MNYLIVRTKLQAIIGLSLLNAGVLRKPFTLIKLFQLHKKEDSESVYSYYEILEKHAKNSIDIIEADSFFLSMVHLFLAFWHTKLTKGDFFFAVVNYYPIAVAAKLCPGFYFNTFDDGTANTEVRDTSYHSSLPLHGNGIKRSFARNFFPKGASYFNRQRIRYHYTIYKDSPNIVPRDKRRIIEINWLEVLHEKDRSFIDLLNIKSIMLGTRIEDSVENFKFIQERNKYILISDIYIPHPRERLDFSSEKIWFPISPAESIIEYLSKKQHIVVFHYNSSALLGFKGNPAIDIVNIEI